MSRRGTPPVVAAEEPVLVSTPAPVPGTTATTVIPAEVATSPAVSSTVPLPSDQATAVPLPVGVARHAASVGDDILAGELPSVVPEHPSIDMLVPPADPVLSPVPAMVRVPGTVPLPADQITPVAPAAPAPTIAELIAALPHGLIEAIRAHSADLPDPDELRYFPVAYDVDHNGRSYAPLGEPILLTHDEHARLYRATAVTVPWLAGRDT